MELLGRFSAGALISTVTDMAKWDAALYTEKLLKKSSLDQMWTATKLKDGKTADYGFGWGIEKANGHRVVAHGGGIPGFSTQINRYLDDKLTVIVLTNADGDQAGVLAQGIAGRVLPALAKKAAAPSSRPQSPTKRSMNSGLPQAATPMRSSRPLMS